jgi:Domain of unknown function (DUF5615)
VKVRFLIDEDLALGYVTELGRHDGALDVLRVGMAGAPPFSTPDPEILLYCERERRALITESVFCRAQR